jgi:hypothetical protein
MPDIYDINFETQETNILPPPKRLRKMFDYLFSILYPLQWLRDLLLGDYKTGANYPNYNAFSAYTKGDRVFFFGDKGIYERTVTGSASGLNGPPSDPTRWMKIQYIFIGTDERIKYNSQIIMLEYELNRYYKVSTTDPQIFINNNSAQTNVFVMGNTGPTSSAMANNSSFSTSWMGNAPTFPAPLPDFTVNVPTSLLSTLGLTLQDQINNVRQFVDKYKLGGMTYNVIAF